MGTLFRKRNKWGINYMDPTGKRIRKVISPYKEAAANALKKVEIEIAEDKYLDVRKTKPILFEDFAKQFSDAHIRLENRSIRNQLYLLNGLVKAFQDKFLHEITTFHIKQYMAKRSKDRSASTVNKDLTMLKSIFNRANEWQMLNGHNPAKSIKKLKEDNERCRWLTEEEQQRLLSLCQGVTRVIVLIALKTGLRWGEIINLKWRQAPNSNYVDFENDTIFIHESLSKSKKPRYVPLADSVKQALMDFPQHSEAGYIFVNPKTGKPYDNVKKSFHSALRKAGIKDFRFHDLRHCFASQLVRNGVDLYVVQKLLSHSSPKMTQRYAHLRDDHLREAVEGLERPKNLFDDTRMAPAQFENSL